MEPIISKRQITFVQFYTTLCWTCLHFIRSTLVQLSEKMHEEHNGLVRIATFNCKKSPEICEKYNIRKYPTFLTFESGKMVGSYVGEPILTGFQIAIDEFLQRSDLKLPQRSERMMGSELSLEMPIYAKNPEDPEAECLAGNNSLCWKYSLKTKKCSMLPRCLMVQCKPDRMIGFLHTGRENLAATFTLIFISYILL